MISKRLHAVAPFLLAALTAAQEPVLRIHPSAVPIGIGFPSPFQISLQGVAGTPFTLLADVSGGPTRFAQERFYLGGTPQLSVVTSNRLDGTGTWQVSGSLPNDPALTGSVLYAQAVLLDPRAPNGVFRASTGASLIIGAGIAESFDDDPIQRGWSGAFDRNIRFRLQGGATRSRIVSARDPIWAPPVATDGVLRRSGQRLQSVYRTTDLHARPGSGELLTAIRWFPAAALGQDRFARIAVDVGHSDIVPDYRLDVFSQLPIAPNSGLVLDYAQNEKPGDPVGVQRLYDGPYDLDPNDQRPDGYVDYPLERPYPYDATSSLLVDIKVWDDPMAQGNVGQMAWLAVPSSPFPRGRVLSEGVPGAVIDPQAQTRAQYGDSLVPQLQFEFRELTSTCLSPFYDSRRASPNYDQPILASAVPGGSSIALEFRGAVDAQGSQATAFSSNVDVADGFPYVQVRVTFTNDWRTGAAASIDTLLIPVN